MQCSELKRPRQGHKRILVQASRARARAARQIAGWQSRLPAATNRLRIATIVSRTRVSARSRNAWAIRIVDTTSTRYRGCLGKQCKEDLDQTCLETMIMNGSELATCAFSSCRNSCVNSPLATTCQLYCSCMSENCAQWTDNNCVKKCELWPLPDVSCRLMHCQVAKISTIHCQHALGMGGLCNDGNNTKPGCGDKEFRTGGVRTTRIAAVTNAVTTICATKRARSARAKVVVELAVSVAIGRGHGCDRRSFVDRE